MAKFANSGHTVSDAFTNRHYHTQTEAHSIVLNTRGKRLLNVVGQREMSVGASVTRSGDLLDFGQLFKAFGNN